MDSILQKEVEAGPEKQKFLIRRLSFAERHDCNVYSVRTDEQVRFKFEALKLAISNAVIEPKITTNAVGDFVSAEGETVDELIIYDLFRQIWLYSALSDEQKKK